MEKFELLNEIKNDSLQRYYLTKDVSKQTRKLLKELKSEGYLTYYEKGLNKYYELI